MENFISFNSSICRFAGDREARRESAALHLALKHVAQAMPRAFEAEICNPILRLVHRPEKRQALDVVPMRVGPQHRHVQRLVLEPLHQLTAEQTQTSARIQNSRFSFARISMQEGFPPYSVSGPGAGVEPRTPQNFRRAVRKCGWQFPRAFPAREGRHSHRSVSKPRPVPAD